MATLAGVSIRTKPARIASFGKRGLRYSLHRCIENMQESEAAKV